MVCSVVGMTSVYTRQLNDQELRLHLQRGDSITFTDAVRDWVSIERQIERLGFGHAYAVSRASRPDAAGPHRHTRVAPLHMTQA
jgi:hypothetical protein